MSGRAPILDDPIASAGRLAVEIVDLEPGNRPDRLAKAERDFYEAACGKGRTEGEAEFFAGQMRRLIEEAMKRILALL
jgi:hypothetical protein